MFRPCGKPAFPIWEGRLPTKGVTTDLKTNQFITGRSRSDGATRRVFSQNSTGLSVQELWAEYVKSLTAAGTDGTADGHYPGYLPR